MDLNKMNDSQKTLMIIAIALASGLVAFFLNPVVPIVQTVDTMTADAVSLSTVPDAGTYDAGEVIDMTEEKTANGDTVKVHYNGTLEKDGSKFDSSYDRGQPLEFVVGAGQMIKGFDAGVVGMAVGDKKTVTLAPEEAYGETQDNLTMTFPMSSLPEGQEPTVGSQMVAQTPTGQVATGIVKSFDDTNFVIDFNHPLAGETLIFEIEMVEIKKA